MWMSILKMRTLLIELQLKANENDKIRTNDQFNLKSSEIHLKKLSQ